MSEQDSEDRFRSCFSDHARTILGYALRRTFSPNDAADVVADTMLVAWRRVDEMPDEPETLLWLYSVARNVISNANRGHRRRIRLAEKLHAQLTASIPAIEVSQPAFAADVTAAIQGLPHIEREVLLLSASECLSPAEIATLLSMNQNTVRSHLHRARLRLRTQLASRGLLDEDSLPQRTTAVGHEAAERTPLCPTGEKEHDDE